MLALSCAIAAEAAIARSGSGVASPPPVLYASAAFASGSCLPEVYAYLRVEAVAEELGEYRNMLEFALDDLRTQLVDCLSIAGTSDEPESSGDPDVSRLNFLSSDFRPGLR